MSAGEPEETDAYQQIFDDMINSEVDYEVTVEPVGDFEEQFQIRAEGGTLQVAAVPQPGTVQQMAAEGQIQALEDMGVDVDALDELVGADFLALGEYEGKHYGVPTNINLKSMVWYPKDDFDAAGYAVPETWDDLIALSDEIKADGTARGASASRARVRRAGRPPTGWRTSCSAPRGPTSTTSGSTRDPLQRPGRGDGRRAVGEILFTDGYVLGGAAADLAFAMRLGPLFPTFPRCYLHRQASFIASSRRSRGRRRRRLRLVPAPAHRPGGHPLRR